FWRRLGVGCAGTRAPDAQPPPERAPSAFRPSPSAFESSSPSAFQSLPPLRPRLTTALTTFFGRDEELARLELMLAPLTHSPLTTHHSPLTTHHSPLTTHHSPL